MTSDSNCGRIIGDRYFLLDEIGQGGMASVHLARDQRSGHFVAVKWLTPACEREPVYRASMHKEADMLARVQHSNVVQLIDFQDTGVHAPYLVLEALVGETLYEYLARHGAMPATHALPLVVQLGCALDAVHRAGIVHSDVKPHNVFLCGTLDKPDGIKLFDFGCAQLINEGASPDNDTVAGTPEYMAPEQILCDPLDARTDIYSFGITLYRWLTGELPFDSGPMLGLLSSQLTSPAPSPSWLVGGLPPGLEQIILTAMRKDPANRYASMADLLADLTCISNGKSELRCVPMLHEPDQYRPRNERGQRALELFNLQGSAACSSTIGA